MPNREIKSIVDQAISIAPAAFTANATGTGVDLNGYDAASVHFQCGVITDGAHTPKVQESDDNLSYSDVAAADLEGSLVAFTGTSVQRVGYRGAKRYIRAFVTSSGATGAVYAAEVVRGYSHQKPLA